VNRSLPSWEEINAYVDDELSPAEKARVAAAIALQPALAEQVAVLSSIKAELQNEYASDALRQENVVQGQGNSEVGSINGGGLFEVRRWALAAACLLVALTCVLTLGWKQEDPMAQLFAAAAERHAALSQAPGSDLGVARSLVRFDRGVALIPDLEAGRLTLNALADFVTPSGAIGMAAHYRGTRGCKLTLFFLPDLESATAHQLPEEDLQRRSDGKILSYSWRHGPVGYLLLAQGMDETRLGLIAEKLREASKSFRILDEAEREQLAESRKRSAACHA
jgi:hypothetical protein